MSDSELEERLVDLYGVEIALLSEDDGSYQKRSAKPLLAASVEQEIDATMPVVRPYLDAVREYEMARGYLEALAAGYRSEDGPLMDWSNGEQFLVDRQERLRKAGARIGEIEEDDRVLEAGHKLRMLLRLKATVAQEDPA